MLRYFVAVPLPAEAKDRLVAVQPSTDSGMRLIERQEMHLTLHFLGELAPRDDKAVRKTLASVKASDFTFFEPVSQR